MKAARISYGPNPEQFGELYIPRRSVYSGVIVVIHGGFWRAMYDLDLGRALARDLAAHGMTAVNLEYRRVGNGGGWPTTCADVAAGIDALAGADVDTSHVVTIGHSAGGHLAVWAAGRRAGLPGGAPVVPVTAAVSQAGVLDFQACCRDHLGDDALLAFMGGRPEALPQEYRAADPMRHVPLDVPVRCVHGVHDDTVPVSQSAAYVAAATTAGADATLTVVDGDHFTLVDHTSPDWRVVRDMLPELLTTPPRTPIRTAAPG